jgi:folate-binding protein YgfZ
VLVAEGSANAVWEALLAAARETGGMPAGDAALEAQRILRGLGASGHELTEDHNPLEAGLRDAVSFTKGCYVGQEVVARLENYDKVVRSLAGIEFVPGEGPAPGDALFIEGREIGRVTSAIAPAGLGRGVGLAFVKHREVALPAQARAGRAEAGRPVRLVPLPFPEAAAFAG